MVRGVTEPRPRAGRSPAWSVVKTEARLDLFLRWRARPSGPEAISLAILKALAQLRAQWSGRLANA